MRVVDSDAPSHQSRTSQAVLHTAEAEKQRKFLAACQDRRDGFTPLCFSVDSMLGTEAG